MTATMCYVHLQCIWALKVSVAAKHADMLRSLERCTELTKVFDKLTAQTQSSSAGLGVREHNESKQHNALLRCPKRLWYSINIPNACVVLLCSKNFAYASSSNPPRFCNSVMITPGLTPFTLTPAPANSEISNCSLTPWEDVAILWAFYGNYRNGLSFARRSCLFSATGSTIQDH